MFNVACASTALEHAGTANFYVMLCGMRALPDEEHFLSFINRDWGIFWCDHFILGVWGSTHQLQRTDQVFAKRVQMQLQSVSELGVHLYGRWGNRRAGWLHLPTLRLPQLRLLPGTQCFNRYCLFIDMFHPSSVCFFWKTIDGAYMCHLHFIYGFKAVLWLSRDIG